VTPGRHPPEHGRSAALSGLVLFEAGKLIPIPVHEAGQRTEIGAGPLREHRSRGKQREARESVGRNLRRAFPLPDSGSFAGLLDRLEEA
jgi:hypothetical protein